MKGGNIIISKDQTITPNKKGKETMAISAAVKKAIINDYSNTTMTVSSIENKHKVSKQTIYNTLIEYYGSDKIPSRRDRKKKMAERSINRETNENPIGVTVEFAGEIISDPDLIRIPSKTDMFVECWLVSDRHEGDNRPRPGIFEGFIDNETINSFDKITKRIKEFIDANVPKDNDGNYTKTLVVYLSGLQVALSCLMMYCIDHKVPLHLMHYNGNSDYNRQVVVGDPYVEINTIYDSIDGEQYFYNTTPQVINELAKSGYSPYALYLADAEENEEGKMVYSNKKYVFCTSIDDAFKVYPKFLKAHMGKFTKHAIYLIQLKMNMGNLQWDEILCKSFNFQSPKKQ